MTAPIPVQQADRPEGWWAYPFMYALGVYVVGLVPDQTWWAGPVIGLALALLGRVLARHAFHPVTHGESFSWWAQTLAVLAGLSAGVWLTVSRFYGGPLATWQWLVYAAAALGLGHLLLMWIAPTAARVYAATPPQAYSEVSLQVLYQGVLKRAGSTDVQVTDVVVSPSGGVESVHITPALPVEGEKQKAAVTRATFTNRLPAIVVELDRTLRRRTKAARIDDQDVHVEQGRGGSEWIMHVTVARPLDVTTHFVPAETPQPWCGPKRVGRYEDDKVLTMTFCDEEEGSADGELVATKGGGKTGALNVIIARGLESDQGEVWLLGTQKLIKLARPWLEPWLRGETDRPAIDWVAGEGITPVLRALDSALQYAIACNRMTKGNSARKATSRRRALRIVMDECGDTLERRDTIVCCDGVKRNASQLVAKIQDISRSALVEIWKGNQNALFDSFGQDGNKQRRNIGIGVAGKCKTPQDADRVIPGLPRANPVELRKQAVFVEQAYEEPREVRARFDHIEDDRLPALARKFTPWRGGLDPDITRNMPYYADRWKSQWHAALITEIEAEGLVWPGDAPHTEAAPSLVKQQDTAREEPAVSSTDPTAYRNPNDLVDLWDLFNTEQAPPADDAPAAAAGSFANPDPSAMVAGFRRMAEWVRDREAQQQADAGGVPDPLGVVIALLDQPGAPSDWVSTEVLAMATGRVAVDADAEAKRRAAEQLGRELTGQDKLLAGAKSQRSFGNAQGKRVRQWGYDVAALRRAADRARR